MKNFLLGLLIIPSLLGAVLIIHTALLNKTDGEDGEITNRLVRLELVWLAMNKPHLFIDVMPSILIDVEDRYDFPLNTVLRRKILVSSAFRFNYFIKKNPVISQDLNYDKDQIKQYWITHLNDCLDSSPSFDPIYYLDRYKDLKKVYGSSCSDAIKHWVKYGVAEGRKGVEKQVCYYDNDYSVDEDE
ncbi:MAG: hypothetical protein ACKE9I_08315 [Methylophagaceae bacterium]